MGTSPAERNRNDDTSHSFFFIERFAGSHNDIDGLIAYALFKSDKKEEKISLRRRGVTDEEITRRVEDWCVTNSEDPKLENYIKKARELSASFILKYQKSLEDERDNQTAEEIKIFKNSYGWKRQLSIGVLSGLIAAIAAPLFYLLLEKAIQESDVANPLKH